MSQRILIVEDESHIGFGIKFNCEQEGFQATWVTDGPSALQLLEDETSAFDLIILDLMLPAMNGYTLLEKFRDKGGHIPVLILSARTLTEDRIRGFDAGADQYMTKPFELKELISRVRGLLNRHAQIRGTPTAPATTAEDVYEFDGAVINFTRHEVKVRGEPKSLTSLEIKLLKCFIESEGVVLPRNELLDRVWGMDSSPMTRTVDNFIVRLRQHFEVDPASPRHFLSVRGVGYRFIAHPEPTDAAVDSTEP